jgi:predicted RNA-binding Zn ribbon-like protein
MIEVKDIELSGGHPVLDFANSWESPGLPSEVNYLGDYETLLAWALRAELLPRAQATVLQREAKAHPLKAKAAWERAIALRKSLLALVHALTQHRAAAHEHVRAVNAAIADALAARALSSAPAGLSWSWKDPKSVDIVSWEIALQASALLTDETLMDRIKTCANGRCDWVFLDLSHAGRRRWCRMGVCGTADKVRKFRERQRRQSKAAKA